MPEDLKTRTEAPIPQELQSLITVYEGTSDDQWIQWSSEWGEETTRLMRNTAVAMLALGEEGRKKRRAEGVSAFEESQIQGGNPQSAVVAPLYFISEAALKRIETGLNKVIT